MEGLLEVFERSLPTLVGLTWLYWVLGSAVYSLKFMSPAFDRFTSYGKLRPRGASGSATFPWWIEHRIAFPVFYIFGFFWNLLVILVQLALWQHRGWQLWKSLPFSLLLQAQVTRRAYECLCVHKYSPNYVSLFQFVAGVSYYGAASFDVMELLASPELDVFSGSWLSLVGALGLFLYCSYVQHQTHRALADLRKGSAGVHEYFIPAGGWFTYLSSPHYTAEILSYAALVWLTNGQVVSIWLSMMFVALNISHSALRTHEWYKGKFKDYPRGRRAVIPFVL
mmetsp:Transcript_8864/g.36685  ORF Transcript_8864/g.36685 Transcript_8864/m.36685 type:complete len:281 (-) Transcript_8864:46-888(-)